MDKEAAKVEIQKLIDKYNKIVAEGKVPSYKEEMTKKDFILPLFRILGWSVEDSNEVSAEEAVSKTRVDYGFRINGVPKFFLEAKALREDLNDQKFRQQAVNYAYYKGCEWAILTNFKSLILLNASLKEKSVLKTMYCEDYAKNFEELYFLSREAFENKLLDKEAEKWGGKARKLRPDKQLLSDLTVFREKLSKSILKLNKNITEKDLDEVVQRILDRLIFIRNCEDREIEEKSLLSNARIWRQLGHGQLIKALRQVFFDYRANYNSTIFGRNGESHLSDEVEVDNEVLFEIIEGLYHTKDNVIEYDFSLIDSDILGNIYEQYLGHLLHKTEKRAKVDESHAKRKEQGIYYTPTYIVDYIVKNTIGELAKEKTSDEMENITVLDPACGSGSFLIKSYDALENYFNEKGKAIIKKGNGEYYTLREHLLTKNIHGVDLDLQAVEIAQLNLLMKIATKGHKLPLITKNIQNGNSLIDDEVVAGDKAFKWEERFPDIIQYDENGKLKEGYGFDVVIGNPPYIRNRELNKNDKAFMNKSYETAEGQWDIYQLFFERAIKLLKDGGYLGFITSNKYATAEYGKNLRQFLLENCKIISIIDASDIDVFKDASTYPYVIILQKCSNKNALMTNMVEIAHISTDNEIYDIRKTVKNQSDFNNDKNLVFNLNIVDSALIRKLNIKTKLLGELCEIREAIHTGNIREKVLFNEKKNDFCQKVIGGRDISRYNSNWNGKWILYNPAVIDKKKGEYGNFPDKMYFDNPKLLIRDISLRLTATYDDSRLYCLNTLYSVILKNNNDRIDLKYILGILNSNLINYVFSSQFSGSHVSGGYLRFKPMFTKQLPIHLATPVEQKPIVELVDRMLSLNKKLADLGDKNTTETARLKEEIAATDAKIDSLVYALYGITEEEKKIIEDSLKK